MLNLVINLVNFHFCRVFSRSAGSLLADIFQILVEGRADGEDEAVIDPTGHVLVELVFAMFFVIDHDIRPIAQLAQLVDSLQILLFGRVEVHDRIDDDPVLVPLAVPLPYLTEQPELRQDDRSVLVPVPSEMQLAQLALVQHLGFLLSHHADVESLVDVNDRTAVDELLKERLPVLAGEEVREVVVVNVNESYLHI